MIKEKDYIDDKIEISEVIFEESKSILGLQFKQYGMTENDVELNEFTNFLKNKEEKQRIIDQIINKKVIEHLKNKTKIIKKSISLDDFKLTKIYFMSPTNEFKVCYKTHGINSNP